MYHHALTKKANMFEQQKPQAVIETRFLISGAMLVRNILTSI